MIYYTNFYHYNFESHSDLLRRRTDTNDTPTPGGGSPSLPFMFISQYEMRPEARRWRGGSPAEKAGGLWWRHQGGN